jgi:hypothetical protein
LGLKGLLRHNSTGDITDSCALPNNDPAGMPSVAQNMPVTEQPAALLDDTYRILARRR